MLHQKTIHSILFVISHGFKIAYIYTNIYKAEEFESLNELILETNRLILIKVLSID